MIVVNEGNILLMRRFKFIVTLTVFPINVNNDKKKINICTGYEFREFIELLLCFFHHSFIVFIKLIVNLFVYLYILQHFNKNVLNFIFI